MSFTISTGTQQLTAQPKDSSGNNMFGVGAPVWASSNPAVATVNGSGLMTAIAAGTATITATLQGIIGSTVVTVLGDEIAFLRGNIVGGDSAILAFYSAQSGVASSGGFVATMSDVRGGGFGPDLTPTDAQGPALVGSDPNTRVLRGSASHALQSALTSLFDLTSPKSVVYVGGMAGATPHGSPFLIENGAITSYLICDPSAGQYTGFVSGGGAVNSGDQQRRAQSAKRRLYMLGCSGANITLRSPLLSPYIVGGGSFVGGTHRLMLLAQNGTYSQDDLRAVLVFNRVLTSQDITTLEQWARTYHSAITNAPSLVVGVGDSIIAGYQVDDTDARQNFFSTVMENAALAIVDDANMGVGGRTWDLTSADLSTITPLLIGRTKPVLWLNCGINDTTTESTGAAAVVKALAYCDAAKAAVPGLKIAINTLIPCGWNGTMIPANQTALNTWLSDYNNGIRAGFTGHADAVIDYTLDAPFNDPTSFSNATYYFQPGQIHPTAASDAILAARALATIVSLAT